MLRFGLLLFFISTAAILLRAFDLVTLASPMLKTFCLISLTGSLICFMGTYWEAERFAARKASSPRTDPIPAPDIKMQNWVPAPAPSRRAEIAEERELAGVK